MPNRMAKQHLLQHVFKYELRTESVLVKRKNRKPVKTIQAQHGVQTMAYRLSEAPKRLCVGVSVTGSRSANPAKVGTTSKRPHG